jgi:phosphate transport system protein
MLHERLNELNASFVKMASNTSEMVKKSIRALREKDIELANKVLEEDEVEINQMEIENMEEVVTIIARFQPTATDLRMLIAGAFINRDLERIADHAENIAEFVIYFSELPLIEIPEEFNKMAKMGTEMLDDSIQSLLNGDEKLAKRVIISDSIMNRMTDELENKYLKVMEDKGCVPRDYMNLILIARNLERIADLATNIAESVLFVMESEIYLHRKKDIAREFDTGENGL